MKTLLPAFLLVVALSIKVNAQNVGIGTSDPAEKLHIEISNNGFNTPLLLRNNNNTINGNNGVGIGLISDVTYAVPKAAMYFERDLSSGRGNLHFLVDNSNDANTVDMSDAVMTITRTGMVGIGTIAPSAPLEVHTGSGTLGRFAASLVGTSFAGEDAAITIVGTRTGCNTCDIAGIEFNNWDSNENGGEEYTMAKIVGGSQSVTGNVGNMRFFTNEGNNLQERMRINAEGDVGIGNTGPAVKLHVTDGSTGYSWTPFGGTTTLIEATGGNNLLTLVGSNTSNTSLVFGDSDGQFRGRIRYEHADDRLELWANNTEKVSIISNGNVGIGVNDPLERLHVGGAARIDDLSGTGNRVVFADVDGTLQVLADGAADQVLQTNGAGVLSWADASGGDADWFEANSTDIPDAIGDNIYTNGNVGIGTTIPGAALDVRGSAIFNEEAADVDFRIESTSFPNMFFVDASTNRVGINTNSPTENLDVRGSAVFNEDSYTNVDFRIESNNATHAFFMDCSEDKIGIKVSDPALDLEVNGLIMAKAFVQNDYSWTGISNVNSNTQYTLNCANGYGMVGFSAFRGGSNWNVNNGEPMAVFCLEITTDYLSTSNITYVGSGVSGGGGVYTTECPNTSPFAYRIATGIRVNINANGDVRSDASGLQLRCSGILSPLGTSVDWAYVNGLGTTSDQIVHGATCPTGSFVHTFSAKWSSDEKFAGDLSLGCAYLIED